MKTEIGEMDCICCGKRIPVKQAENGTLSFPCGWCEFPGYAKGGTKAQKLMLAKVTLNTPTETPPAAKKQPSPIPAIPAAPIKPKSTIFG